MWYVKLGGSCIQKLPRLQGAERYEEFHKLPCIIFRNIIYTFLDRTNISASLHPFKNCITSLNKPQTESSAEVTTLQNIKFLSKERTSCRNRNEIDTVHPMAPWSSHLHCTKDAWRNNWRQRAGDTKSAALCNSVFSFCWHQCWGSGHGHSARYLSTEGSAWVPYSRELLFPKLFMSRSWFYWILDPYCLSRLSHLGIYSITY